MKKAWRFLTVSIFMLSGVWMGWRYLSRRRALPCPSWLGWLLEPRFKDRLGNSRPKVLEQMNLQPGMRLLDVGAGPGRLTLPAARMVGTAGEVTALDMQPKMLARLKQRMQKAGLGNIQTIEGKAGIGLLGEGVYDRAILATVLGEIVNQEEAMAEIYRAIKPGGILSVSETLLDPHYQTREKVLRLGKAAGFRPGRYFGSWAAFTQQLLKD